MTYDAPDVSPDVAEIQARRFRAMSPDEKLRAADALWALVWDATKVGVRMRQPHLDERAVERAARAILRAAD